MIQQSDSEVNINKNTVSIFPNAYRME